MTAMELQKRFLTVKTGLEWVDSFHVLTLTTWVYRVALVEFRCQSEIGLKWTRLWLVTDD